MDKKMLKNEKGVTLIAITLTVMLLVFFTTIIVRVTSNRTENIIEWSQDQKDKQDDMSSGVTQGVEDIQGSVESKWNLDQTERIKGRIICTIFL